MFVKGKLFGDVAPCTVGRLRNPRSAINLLVIFHLYLDDITGWIVLFLKEISFVLQILTIITFGRR